MSETLKSTIVGTIIIGVFMLISVKMVTNSVWTMARDSRQYVEAQKAELKQIVKSEQSKAKEVFLMGVCQKNCPMKK